MIKKVFFGRMAYQLFKDEAKKLLSNKDQTKQVVNTANEKAEKNQSQLKSIWTQFKLMLEMLNSYRTGDYTNAPKRTILFIAVGILYFISPIDLIPDFLFGMGLIDDAAVLAFIAKQIHNDIHKYEEWKAEDVREIEPPTE